jgi:hypothetical protein
VRERVVACVKPGGYLLVGTTRTGGDLEDSWWRRMLHRGRWLNEYVGKHRQLETVSCNMGAIAVHTLYKRVP